jgi:hypothetical protein
MLPRGQESDTSISYRICEGGLGSRGQRRFGPHPLASVGKGMRGGRGNGCGIGVSARCERRDHVSLKGQCWRGSVAAQKRRHSLVLSRPARKRSKTLAMRLA